MRIKSEAVVRAATRRKIARRLPGAKHVPKVYNRIRIKELLQKGLSISQVAAIIGCSNWPVQLVKREIKGDENVTDSKINETNPQIWVQA